MTHAVLAEGTTSDDNEFDSFTALVNWGDGSSSAVAVESEDGTFEVLGDHDYTVPGSYQVAVTVYDGIFDYHTSTSITVEPESPDSFPLAAEGVAIPPGSAGTQLEDVTLATFTDDNPAHIGGLHLVTIDWGDQTISEGTVEQDGSDPDDYEVTGSHTYVHPGDYDIHVTIQDQDDVVGASAIATINPNQIDAAPTFIQDVQLAGSDIVVATFTDADLDETAGSFDATIDLENGLPNVEGVVQGGDGHFTVSLPNLAGGSIPSVGNATDGFSPDWYFDYYGSDDDTETTTWAFFGGFSAGERVVTVTITDTGTVVANVNSTVVLRILYKSRGNQITSLIHP